MSGAPLEPQLCARDPLAAELLPVLLHRIHNATQVLATLHALVVETGDAGWLERRASDLAETGESIEGLGYVLAVLASACGADLLMERRDARGIALLCSAARDALRRKGRDLREPDAQIPELEPAAGRGWELAWGVAAALVAGASAPVGEEPPRWSLRAAHSGWELAIEAPPSAALRTLAPLLDERLHGAELALGDEGFRMRFPVSWLRAPARGALA